ncbi:MAG: hypothetical protein IJ708_01795, partial [Clostridia bacterium]|nr:hypothetical protein [Clostridia bacterium]
MEAQERILAQEQDHLTDVRQVIRREVRRLEAQTGIREGEVTDSFISVDAITDEETAEQIFLGRVDALHGLYRAMHNAYFSHLTFSETGKSEAEYYIGRWGVYDPETLTQVVIDWRAPIANLYYAGEIGRVEYTAPDGVIAGELFLRRMLTVEEDRIKGIYDAGVAGQESWLSQVLGTVSSQRLHEIVSSIQSEQNLVIRADLDRSLIVQGVAGSGKTTIALHRIAYLLYRHRENLRPEQIMILAPNPLFLSYISEVLPELGVERVQQDTFEGFARSHMGRELPKVVHPKESGGMPGMEDTAVNREKGSAAFMDRLEKFLQAEAERMLPTEPLTFGGYTVMDVEEIRSLFLHQLSTWPLARRIQEAKKPFKRRLEQMMEKMKNVLEDMARGKLDRLLATLPDGPPRRERAAKLLDSRDARIAEVEEKGKQFLAAFASHFPDMTDTGVYRRFLEAEGGEGAKATLEKLDAKRITPSDLAPLLLIHLRVHGISGEVLRHIVADESQD